MMHAWAFFVDVCSRLSPDDVFRGFVWVDRVIIGWTLAVFLCCASTMSWCQAEVAPRAFPAGPYRSANLRPLPPLLILVWVPPRRDPETAWRWSGIASMLAAAVLWTVVACRCPC